jgi:hypothetical protein
MVQTELNLKPKPMSPQCQKLYDRLLQGPITNAEIRDELRLLEYRRRFKDLKDFHGIQTERKSLGKGVNLYSLKGE